MSDTIKHNVTVNHGHQQEFLRQFMHEILLEQKSYLLVHPEIKLLLKGYIANMTSFPRKPIDVLKHAAFYFTRPYATLQKEINKLLQKTMETQRVFSNKNNELFDYEDLLKLLNENIDEDKEKVFHTENSTSETTTSSFISILTSVSTLMTPDFVEDLEQTTSSKIQEELLEILDKAVLSKVTDEDIQYDIAYVEVMNAVEDAMEIPIIEIRKDVIELLRMAYYVFEFQVAEKEKMGAQNTANNRLRKKWKKIVRYHHNFKGHERPHVAGSKVSSNELLAMESHKYQVQCCFNRYPKNSFGVYLPRESAFSDESVTAAVAIEEMMEKDQNHMADIELTSQKSYETLKAEVLVVSFTELSKTASGLSKNKKLNFLVKNVSESVSISQLNLQSANVVLFKPTRNIFRKDQRQ
ncbi:unnamed protein product [Arctia plantaginis]|uniref:Uncharacterized protein n=1 Tax=Arctia plantaginis TaxID=874455 RepID=A0A8S0YXS6_ARCPL|nr:unnamed protein product [Arctia plantaginis]